MRRTYVRQPPSPFPSLEPPYPALSQDLKKKSKITAERLTLRPRFAKGASSSTPEHEQVRAEAPKLRRSWRLSKKNQPITVSGYFHKLVAEDKGAPEPPDDDFGDLVFGQIRQNFSLRDDAYYKKLVLDEIEQLNDILTGKNERNMSLNRKRAYNEDDKENAYPMKFQYVPQSNWVFQTPPNRKLHYAQRAVEENGMKPAVIETRKNDSKVVYEMNRKINVDLTNFSNRQEIEIDKRYMVEVVTQEEEETEAKSSFLQSDPFELENHFLSLTCRPKKVTSSVPRFNTATLKRKRDIFEPQPGCSTDSDEYKPIFLNNLNLNDMEESFTFKFTTSDCVSGSTTGHLFDFDGNKKDTFNFRF